MKKMTKLFALCSLFLVSAFSMAGSNLNSYPQIQTLLNNDGPVLYSYWGALDNGYTMSETTASPIYYFAAPQGEHQEATVTIVLNKRIGGSYSLKTAYITYTIDIINDGNGNLSVGTMTVERSIVN